MEQHIFQRFTVKNILTLQHSQKFVDEQMIFSLPADVL